MTQVEHRHPEGAKHGSYYYNPESRSNVTKAKLGNRVTSKKHFIVRVFSKNPTKTGPTNRSKGQSFLALWDSQGTIAHRNIASTRTKYTNQHHPFPLSKEAIEKNTLNCILI